jgi:hypothetical protein
MGYDLNPLSQIQVNNGWVLGIQPHTRGGSLALDVYSKDSSQPDYIIAASTTLSNSSPVKMPLKNNGRFLAGARLAKDLLVGTFRSFSSTGTKNLTFQVKNSNSPVFIVNKSVEVTRTMPIFEVTAQPNPVGLTFSGAFVQFTFRYLNLTSFDSSAQVTFWATGGDRLSSRAMGPFLIGMDVNRNTNRIPISYTFKNAGKYVVNFLIKNLNRSSSVQIQVNVVVGLLNGFYIDVQPRAVLPNQNFDVYAYVLEGANITFEWNFNGNVVTKKRTCKLGVIVI